MSPTTNHLSRSWLPGRLEWIADGAETYFGSWDGEMLALFQRDACEAMRAAAVLLRSDNAELDDLAADVATLLRSVSAHQALLAQVRDELRVLHQLTREDAFGMSICDACCSVWPCPEGSLADRIDRELNGESLGGASRGTR